MPWVLKGIRLFDIFLHTICMYIRKTLQKNAKTGVPYCTYRLVEAYRTAEKKVRQRTLLNLGANFSIDAGEWKLLADRIEEILSGQSSLFGYEPHIEQTAQEIAKRVVHRVSNIDPAPEAVISDYQEIDVNTVENQNIRNVGAEYLGFEIAKELKIGQLLGELKFNRKQVNTALGSIIGKLVAPGSERSTHQYLQRQSGLDELMGCDFQQLSLNQLYQISDKLVKHKKSQKVFAR